MKADIVLKRILCPVDFSECSKHAIEYALAFARQYGAEVRLLHAVESPPTFTYGDLEASDQEMIEVFYDQARKRLARLTEAVKARHDLVSREMAFGKPFAEIVNAAEKWEADLIVMGSHGRSGLEHLLIGSVAEKVLRKATCPVLTVRHPEHEFIHPR